VEISSKSLRDSSRNPHALSKPTVMGNVCFNECFNYQPGWRICLSQRPPEAALGTAFTKVYMGKVLVNSPKKLHLQGQKLSSSSE